MSVRVAAIALWSTWGYRASVRMECRHTLGDSTALNCPLIDLMLRTADLLRRATREDGHWDLLLLFVQLRMRLVVG